MEKEGRNLPGSSPHIGTGHHHGKDPSHLPVDRVKNREKWSGLKERGKKFPQIRTL
jgi:hypothetical protein